MVYKGVPLYLEPVELEDMVKGRNSETEVWNQVITDLTDAINTSDFPDKYTKGDGDYGRVTKGAAYALRGKVYMWMNEWTKAEADFRKVGDLGFALFQGEYKQLFKEENEQCEEMIFSLQCIGESGYGNNFSFRYGSRGTFGSCWNTYLASTDFVETYEDADGRPFDWDNYIPGFNSMDVAKRAVYFLRDGMTDEEKEQITETENFVKAYETAMEDDFNTADAIASIFDLVKFANTTTSAQSSKEYLQSLYDLIVKLSDVLGLIVEKEEEMLAEDIEALIEERQAARKERNFQRADEIRDELLKKGIILEDTREGVKWKKA